MNWTCVVLDPRLRFPRDFHHKGTKPQRPKHFLVPSCLVRKCPGNDSRVHQKSFSSGVAKPLHDNLVVRSRLSSGPVPVTKSVRTGPRGRACRGSFPYIEKRIPTPAGPAGIFFSSPAGIFSPPGNC